MEIIRVEMEQLETLLPLFDAYRMTIVGESNLEESRRFLEEIHGKREAVTFMAVEGEGPDLKGLGFVNLYPLYSSLALRRIWILNDLFIGPRARGQGVATELIERVLRFARETGAIRVELKTDVENTGARALYAAMGFREGDGHIHYRVPL